MKIKHSFVIDAKPEMIYSALISPHGIHSWFSEKGSIATEVGDAHVFNYLKEGQNMSMEMQIEELELNKKVVWRCTKHEYPIWENTTLTFIIWENGAFEFTHSNFDPDKHDEERYALVVKAWDYFMKNLKQFCETGEAHPW